MSKKPKPAPGRPSPGVLISAAAGLAVLVFLGLVGLRWLAPSVPAPAGITGLGETGHQPDRPLGKGPEAGWFGPDLVIDRPADAFPWALAPGYAAVLPPGRLEGYPAPFRAAVTDRGVRALPLAFDPAGLFGSKKVLGSLGQDLPVRMAGWAALARAARDRGLVPLAAAGADDEDLWALTAVLTVALRGTEGYGALGRAAVRPDDWGIDEAGRVAPGSPFRPAFDALASWKAEGWLEPGWLTLGAEDVRALVASGRAAVGFGWESGRRGLDPMAAEDRAFRLFPVGDSQTSFSMPVRLLAAVVPQAALPLGPSWAQLDRVAALVPAFTRTTGWLPALPPAQFPDREARDLVEQAAVADRLLTVPSPEFFRNHGTAASLMARWRLALSAL